MRWPWTKPRVRRVLNEADMYPLIMMAVGERFGVSISRQAVRQNFRYDGVNGSDALRGNEEELTTFFEWRMGNRYLPSNISDYVAGFEAAWKEAARRSADV